MLILTDARDGVPPTNEPQRGLTRIAVVVDQNPSNIGLLAPGVPAEISPASEGALHSDLARFCLPSATEEPDRKLAWANSICLLFLSIGLLGVKSPVRVVKQTDSAADVVPVIFTPPPEQRQVPPDPQQPKEELDPNQDNAPDTPQVATVVAADPSAVAFAVPVEGPVVFAPARFAAPPPAKPPAPRKPPTDPAVFQRNSAEGGRYPDPEYPRLALQFGQQGKVTILIEVGAEGRPTTVEVQDSSGHSVLDAAVVNTVKNRWQFPPGELRRYLWTCTFRLDN